MDIFVIILIIAIIAIIAGLVIAYFILKRLFAADRRHRITDEMRARHGWVDPEKEVEAKKARAQSKRTGPQQVYYIGKVDEMVGQKSVDDHSIKISDSVVQRSEISAEKKR